MRAIGLVSVSFVMTTLLATDAQAASNRWCAVTPKRSESCGYATLDQCQAYMLGLGGLVPTQSVSRHGVWNEPHLVVRSATPEPRRVLEVRPQDSNRSSQIGAGAAHHGPTPSERRLNVRRPSANRENFN
jgi:hypothetical protein